MNKRIELFAFTKAREANSGNDELSKHVSQMQTALNTLAENYNQLLDDHQKLLDDHNDLKEKFLNHTHQYSDVDNLGSTQNKTTEIPS